MKKSPAEIIEILSGKQGILNPKYALPNGESNGSVWINEEEANAKLKSVKIIDIEQPFASLKLDVFAQKNPMNFLTNPAAEFINKGADGMLFVGDNHKGYIIICELKSEFPKANEYKPKFQSARCFLDYLESFLKEFYETDFSEFQIINLLFYYSKNDKKPSYGDKRSTPSEVRGKKIKSKPQTTDKVEIRWSELLK